MEMIDFATLQDPHDNSIYLAIAIAAWNAPHVRTACM